jgi:hypothetical protein
MSWLRWENSAYGSLITFFGVRLWQVKSSKISGFWSGMWSQALGKLWIILDQVQITVWSTTLNFSGDEFQVTPGSLGWWSDSHW